MPFFFSFFLHNLTLYTVGGERGVGVGRWVGWVGLGGMALPHRSLLNTGWSPHGPQHCPLPWGQRTQPADSTRSIHSKEEGSEGGGRGGGGGEEGGERERDEREEREKRKSDCSTGLGVDRRQRVLCPSLLSSPLLIALIFQRMFLVFDTKRDFLLFCFLMYTE